MGERTYIMKLSFEVYREGKQKISRNYVIPNIDRTIATTIDLLRAVSETVGDKEQDIITRQITDSFYRVNTIQKGFTVWYTNELQKDITIKIKEL